MADMNGIMAQINALRGSYGGSFGPNSVSQPTSNGLFNNGGLGQLSLNGANPFAAPTPPQLNLGGQGTPSPAAANPFTTTSPMGAGRGAPNGGAGATRLPPTPRSYAPVTAMSGTPSFYDMAMYSQVPRAAPTEWDQTKYPLSGLGEMADPAKMAAGIGLLPQGTDLSNSAIFGSLTPALGYRAMPNEIAKAWTATGNVPIEYFSQFAKPGTMDKFNRNPLPEAWDKMGAKLVRQALNQRTDPRLQNRGRQREE